MKFYLDTSVFGGFFDEEFQYWTQMFFKYIKDNNIRIIHSDIIEQEMKYAPQKVKSLLADNIVEAEQVDISNEALELAELYIQEGALGEKSVDDARHIALATVEGVSALISWNFKHMVNFLKIRQYNSINLREGYRTISIHTPREIVDV